MVASLSKNLDVVAYYQASGVSCKEFAKARKYKQKGKYTSAYVAGSVLARLFKKGYLVKVENRCYKLSELGIYKLFDMEAE